MIDRMVEWIKKQVGKAGAKGCVFGLSGGLDSSVVGALCQRAFPKSCLGLLLPCFSREQDLKHAREVAERFSISTELIDLSPALNQLYLQLEGKPYDGREMNLAIANLKPRLRMTALYYHANRRNYLVVGTGNRSEAVMGYCTKYGDAGVDILPLGGLLKSQVRDIAKELGVPPAVIEKAPSAGLWEGQTDEGEMGITYAELDRIIAGMEKNDLAGLDRKLVEKVRARKTRTEHKRCFPLAFIP